MYRNIIFVIGINKSTKTSNSENIEMPKKIKTSNFETESKSTSQKIFTSDAIRSPTLTEGLHIYLLIF